MERTEPNSLWSATSLTELKMMETENKDMYTGSWWRYAPLRNALLSGLIAGSGFVLAHTGFVTEGMERIFYWIAIPFGGWYWTREGLEKLFKEKVVGIEILMLAAAAGSGILGLWDEAAALVFLYGAAEGTEEYTYARTRASIRALLDLAPREAHVLRNGIEETVPADTLKPGDVFVVRPGESLPTDGIVRTGRSSVDESPVTGESVPVDKEPGAKVFAATINRQGALEVEATASFADNTLAKIIHLVEEAQEEKGAAQQWIERFGRVYTPAVLAGSGLLLFIPWLLGLPLAEWALRAVILLVAAAPCALVMSTPVAMAAGIGAAGRRGILIKGGIHLEHLGSIKVIAFDKTGTLTRGAPQVTDVVAQDMDETRLLSVAAELEHYSEHPLARAIVDRGGKTRTPALVEDFKALSGAGVSGTIAGETWHIGSPALMRELRIDLTMMESQIRAFQEQGKTVVIVGRGSRVSGIIAVSDPLRARAREVVAQLRGQGYTIAMLTGDSHKTARTVGTALGIHVIHADLKPDMKVDVVRRLAEMQGGVLMVGDGVNDAPALASSTCGVAMGAAGTDAAIEAADIALMADDLSKIIDVLELGRKARRVSAQNVAFSILVLAVLIPLALTGLIGIAMTVLVHEASELLAVLNGLRVARFREGAPPSSTQRS